MMFTAHGVEAAAVPLEAGLQEQCQLLSQPC